MIVLAAVLGSGLAMLDGSVVNIALKTIGTELDASLAELVWINNGYLLTLASFILLGGSLGDRFGRRRIFVIGTVWFASASLLCGVAPNAETLIAARLLQGVGSALLTPGSLAMIQGAFRPEDRGEAIGTWSGLGSIFFAIGPFIGGALIDYASWRWIFLVNVPLAAATILVARRWVPETRNPQSTPGLDTMGAVLGALALGGATYALIEWGSAVAWWSAGLGVAAAVAFLLREARTRHPMMPLTLFGDRTFSAANLMTLLVYAALGAISFFLVLQLQTGARVRRAPRRCRHAADHDLHALPRRQGRRARQPDRAADPHERRAAGDGGGCAAGSRWWPTTCRTGPTSSRRSPSSGSAWR